jgi:hypothetical protein
MSEMNSSNDLKIPHTFAHKNQILDEFDKPDFDDLPWMFCTDTLNEEVTTTTSTTEKF